MIEMYDVMSGLEKGHGNLVWELSHLQVRWSHTRFRTTKRRYFFTQQFSWVVKLHYLLLWISKVNIVSEQVGKFSEQLGTLMADWFGKGHWVCVYRLWLWKTLSRWWIKRYNTEVSLTVWLSYTCTLPLTSRKRILDLWMIFESSHTTFLKFFWLC